MELQQYVAPQEVTTVVTTVDEFSYTDGVTIGKLYIMVESAVSLRKLRKMRVFLSIGSRKPNISLRKLRTMCVFQASAL